MLHGVFQAIAGIQTLPCDPAGAVVTVAKDSPIASLSRLVRGTMKLMAQRTAHPFA
jgi:hypothetical protein